MKKTLITSAIIGAAIIAFAATSDPVLMTINGQDVHKSEFEYLYNKNNSQQLTPQTIDEYLDMFINYKLKVQAAQAAGLDTMPEFVEEYNKYRAELAQPYLEDNTIMDSLVNQAYTHFADELVVSHIMMGMTGQPELDAKAKATMDSIYTEIQKGTITFEDAAKQYSIDKRSSMGEGRKTILPPAAFPWDFEEVAYNLKVGEISPVFSTAMGGRPIGYHIVKLYDRRPSSGEVNASHILLLTQNMNDEQKAEAKARIDSIYNVVTTPGADFADVAKRLSQDPGSARNGGALNWFGRGAMVAEFDSVAFALADGEISKPFATRFGYHIIKRNDSRGVRPLDDVRERIMHQIDSDERGLMPQNVVMERLYNKFNSQILPTGLDAAKETILKASGKYDSVAVAALNKLDAPVISVGKKTFSVADVMPSIARTNSKDVDNAVGLLQAAAENVKRIKTIEAQREALYNEEPAYRNLLNEYRDGILLFDISNREVWEKAAQDTLGLENYFKANRKNYAWNDGPRFKSYIVFVANDSVLELAKAYTDSIGNSPVNPKQFGQEMRAKFGRDVRVERVIAPQGKNPITDYLAFGGPKPSDDVTRWAHYYAFQGHIIDIPEEAADVRAAVTADYQNKLEKDWVDKLHKQFSVKVNKKVFNSLKK